MSFDKSLRTRVRRLLAGEYAESHFNELLLALRQRPKRPEVLAEVGHFVAHREERDRGITADSMAEFAVKVRALHVIQQHAVVGIDPDAIPVALRHLPQINLRDQGVSRYRKRTGITEIQAILRALESRIVENGNGTFCFRPPLSDRERIVFNALVSEVKIESKLNADQLFNQFRAFLTSHGLLDPSERAAAVSLKAPLALFAASRMHQAKLLLPDGNLAELYASGTEGTLRIFGAVPWAIPTGGMVRVAACVFNTGLSVADHCDAELASVAADDQRSWTAPLELLPSGKLREIPDI